MIKTKQDAIKIANDLKVGGILNYSNDISINSFRYDSENNCYRSKIESKVSRFKSNGLMSYDTIVNQIWIDRKYINNMLK